MFEYLHYPVGTQVEWGHLVLVLSSEESDDAGFHEDK